MTRKRKYVLALCLTGFAVTVGVVWWKRAIVGDLVAGQFVMRKYSTGLPDCERVELTHLSEREWDSKKRLLPVRVLGKTELTGPAAMEFVRLWRSQSFGSRFSMLCHEPGYGIKFIAGQKVLFETTLCFECHNFQIENSGNRSFWGFDPSSPQGVQLLGYLQKLFPASVPPPSTRKTVNLQPNLTPLPLLGTSVA